MFFDWGGGVCQYSPTYRAIKRDGFTKPSFLSFDLEALNIFKLDAMNFSYVRVCRSSFFNICLLKIFFDDKIVQGAKMIYLFILSLVSALCATGVNSLQDISEKERQEVRQGMVRPQQSLSEGKIEAKEDSVINSRPMLVAIRLSYVGLASIIAIQTYTNGLTGGILSAAWFAGLIYYRETSQ